MAPLHQPSIPTDAGGENWGLIWTYGRFYTAPGRVQYASYNQFRVAAVDQLPGMTSIQLHHI